MSKRTQQQIEQLRNDLLRHNKLYYIDAQPEITDLEYDQLLKELHRLEQLYPEYDSPESPTKRVGEQPVDHLVTVDHRLPMLSIDNTYNLDELRKFGQRTKDAFDGRESEWAVELKIDGVAASVIYENGVLVRALTQVMECRETISLTIFVRLPMFLCGCYRIIRRMVWRCVVKSI